LADAEECVKINPGWSKGYARKGAALHGSRKYDEAIAAYEEGLKLEDSAPLRKGLKEVQDAKAHDSAGGEGLGLGKMFSDPNLLGKLASNPRTSKHLADPAFVQKLRMLQTNPQLADGALNGDPRMIDVLGALMGIDMQAFNRDEGSDELPPGFTKDAPTPPPKPSPPPPQASTSKPTPPPAKVEEDVVMEEVDEEEAKAKKEAEAEKKLGADAYKARDFDSAVTHFSKAWELWPKDITFLTNLGAVYYEQGEYDKCIETCQKAVDEGREIRADYKLVAKAYGRIGTAYTKKDDLASAIKFFNKSLTEHRTSDILNKLRETERIKSETERNAYINPELSAQAREEGNTLFKKGDFAGAVKAYTESIKRNPDDARGYNNRANAYTKLAALPEALKDADQAIKVDPKFIKAYIRKSHILLTMRDHSKAIEALQEAAEHDEEKQHTKEIQDQIWKCQQAQFSSSAGETDEEVMQRAMRDPEVAGIMSDPIMQSILQQAQGNPAALQDHMKNPVVRQKINKLISAGIIKTR